MEPKSQNSDWFNLPVAMQWFIYVRTWITGINSDECRIVSFQIHHLKQRPSDRQEKMPLISKNFLLVKLIPELKLSKSYNVMQMKIVMQRNRNIPVTLVRVSNKRMKPSSQAEAKTWPLLPGCKAISQTESGWGTEFNSFFLKCFNKEQTHFG